MFERNRPQITWKRATFLDSILLGSTCCSTISYTSSRMRKILLLSRRATNGVLRSVNDQAGIRLPRPGMPMPRPDEFAYSSVNDGRLFASRPRSQRMTGKVGVSVDTNCFLAIQ